MKLRNIIASFLAVVAIAVGCTQELTGNLGSIKLDQSTVVFPEEGGSVTITVTAKADWSVDAATVPEGMTITPMSGGAGETKMTISTTASANDIDSDIVIVVGTQKQFITFYQPGDPALKPQFEEFVAGDYWIMCQEGGEWFALKSTGCEIDNEKSYNYLYSVAAMVAEDGTLSSTASNVFTFEAVEGGFAIKDPSGGYLYQAAAYNNFYLTSDISKAAVWTVEQISEDEFMIENPSLSKWFQYSTGYDSAGAYGTAQDGATLPKLVKAEAPAAEPFVIETTEFELPIEAGEVVIPVEYNGVDIHVAELPSWLTFYGYHDGEIKFTYESNEGGNREAVVVLTTCMDGNECTVELTFTQEGVIAKVTVAEFLAAEEGDALYEMTGKISKIRSAYSEQYNNISFNLMDDTGETYIYRMSCAGVENPAGLRVGDIITVQGKRSSYNSEAQMAQGETYVSHVGSTDVTVAEFLAKPVSDDVRYRLTGEITSLKAGNYGNFQLKDETGTVYVYGLTVAPVAKNDQSFPNLGLKEGDVVTLVGTRAQYPGAKVEEEKEQVGGPAYYVSHVAGSTEPEEPETPVTPPAAGSKYVKVTADQADWSGKYLIVFGSNAHANLTSKDLNSTVPVTIVNDEIEAKSDLAPAVMTVVKNGDKYNMTFADGKYFGMQHNGCKLMDSAFELGFAYTDAGVKISGQATKDGATNTYFLYENASGTTVYYRCYVEKNGQSGYNLPALYKLAE